MVHRSRLGCRLVLLNNPFLPVACLCGLLLVAPTAHALDPIDTDGPDFVESSETVPKDHFQYEVDVAAEQNRRASPRATNLATPTLLKYGATDNIEIRIAPGGYVRRDGQSGIADTAFGIKWHSQDRDAHTGRPAVSWILHVDAPTGSGALRGQGARPSLRSVITWDLPHDFALGIMPGIKSDTAADRRRFTSAILGVVLNQRINEKFRCFVEMSAAQIARARDGGVLNSWDIGAAYLATSDIQLGMRAGVAANRNTPGGFVLFEVAQRF